MIIICWLYILILGYIFASNLESCFSILINFHIHDIIPLRHYYIFTANISEGHKTLKKWKLFISNLKLPVICKTDWYVIQCNSGVQLKDDPMLTSVLNDYKIRGKKRSRWKTMAWHLNWMQTVTAAIRNWSILSGAFKMVVMKNRSQIIKSQFIYGKIKSSIVCIVKQIFSTIGNDLSWLEEWM